MLSFLCSQCVPPQLVPTRERVSHRRHHDKRRQWSPRRDPAAHKRFARAVLKANGSSCEVCGSPFGVQVHHRDGDVANNDPSNGVVLCPRHHREVDSHAR
jgi:hypothetical protein